MDFLPCAGGTARSVVFAHFMDKTQTPKGSSLPLPCQTFFATHLLQTAAAYVYVQPDADVAEMADDMRVRYHYNEGNGQSLGASKKIGIEVALKMQPGGTTSQPRHLSSVAGELALSMYRGHIRTAANATQVTPRQGGHQSCQYRCHLDERLVCPDLLHVIMFAKFSTNGVG
jgi:hypothetical protein